MAVRRTTSLTSIWYGVLAAFAVVVLIGAGANWMANSRVDRAVQAVNSTAVPAQGDAAALTTAYVRQGVNILGYILTASLDNEHGFEQAVQQADDSQRTLTLLLAGDPTGANWMRRVAASGSAWETAAETQAVARARAINPTYHDIAMLAINGELALRGVLSDLNGLNEYTRTLTLRQTARISAARTDALIITLSSVALTLLVVVVALVIMRRTIARPMARLLRQVRGTTDGTHDAPIDTHGPAELVIIGEAVESMRRTIVDRSEQLVASERSLAQRDERDRLAADLHDLTVQRVFALGLELQSLATRRPELADDLEQVIDDAEHTISELRAVIYGISRSSDGAATPRDEIRLLVHESARFLGFEPTISLDGPIDRMTTPEIVAGLTATVREALSNIARHADARWAEVRVVVRGTDLHLVVTDDGRGIDPAAERGNGLNNMASRAQRLGGTAEFSTPPEGGTRLHWQVPLLEPATAIDPVASRSISVGGV